MVGLAAAEPSADSQTYSTYKDYQKRCRVAKWFDERKDGARETLCLYTVRPVNAHSGITSRMRGI
jgi:hypothetical protein